MVSPGLQLVATTLFWLFLNGNITDSSQSLALLLKPGFSSLLFANQRRLESVKE